MLFIGLGHRPIAFTEIASLKLILQIEIIPSTLRNSLNWVIQNSFILANIGRSMKTAADFPSKLQFLGKRSSPTAWMSN